MTTRRNSTGGPDRAAVAAVVANALRHPVAEPKPSPLDDLPDDPIADLGATRVVLARMRVAEGGTTRL